MTNTPFPFGPSRTSTDFTPFGARLFRRVWTGHGAAPASVPADDTLEWARRLLTRTYE